MTRDDLSESILLTRVRWGVLAVALPFLATLTLAGCGNSEAKPTDQANRQGGAGQKQQGGPGAKPPLETLAVSVEPATRGDIATYNSATASLDPDKEADVLARVQGPIKRILAEEGDDVREGQVLLLIDDTEYQHRLTQAKVALDQGKVKFARIENIISQGLVSKESFDTAKAELDAAKAAYELAALELSWCEVRAPFTGRIIRRQVDQGRNVSNGSVLFSLADMRRLLARVHVPAREFRKIQTSQPVRLTVDSTGDELTGRIDLVSPIVDPRTGTIKVTVEITAYPPSTRPGNFAQVSIVTDVHAKTLVVPLNAVLTEKDQRVLYIAEGETARRTVVETGYEDDRFVEIVGGIAEGASIVVQGQRSLADGQPIRILDKMDLDPKEAEGEAAKQARTQGAG
ncbi:MAG: efflux RND transporter periplasmic adaptor subunit [Thermoanaerobaculia bacterium]